VPPSCTYTVMWRAGGSRTGKTQRQTVDDKDVAKRFRDLVNGHGQHWPPGWAKGVFGFVEPDEDSVPDSEMFRVYAGRRVLIVGQPQLPVIQAHLPPTGARAVNKEPSGTGVAAAGIGVALLVAAAFAVVVRRRRSGRAACCSPTGTTKYPADRETPHAPADQEGRRFP
jgi:hypothetical protein